MASVRPIAAPSPAPPLMLNPPAVTPAPEQRVRATTVKPAPAKPVRAHAPGATLDGGWDRRLARGLVAPDSSIDLHGHSLNTAYAVLDQGLERAIARGDRVLLLVTGKPPRPESERPHARGAIRAAVGDWLAGSRHADRIAAVRGAHPRHGGAGALYIILRRPRQVS
jgi:DNA-nicking Smr family endonuclease